MARLGGLISRGAGAARGLKGRAGRFTARLRDRTGKFAFAGGKKKKPQKYRKFGSGKTAKLRSATQFPQRNFAQMGFKKAGAFRRAKIDGARAFASASKYASKAKAGIKGMNRAKLGSAIKSGVAYGRMSASNAGKYLKGKALMGAYSAAQNVAKYSAKAWRSRRWIGAGAASLGATAIGGAVAYKGYRAVTDKKRDGRSR